MKRVIIIHGSYGYPTENWIPWLKTELNKLGVEVMVPQFPTPEGQDLSNWLKVLAQYEGKLTDETILVGHSVGASFIPSAIEYFNRPIKAAVLVAGFVSQLEKESPLLQVMLSTFVDKDFDWERIRILCPEFVILQSDNDPHVSFEKAGELARGVGAEITIIKNAGHFNVNSGYGEKFPQLLERLKELI